MRIFIREYRDCDWERLQAIHDPARMQELTLAGLEAAFLPLSVAAENEDLFGYTLAVAELEGEVVGFAAWSRDELAWLYVDPAWRRRGVGIALVQHALRHIPERPVLVEVLVGNLPARQLYESAGFELKETASGHLCGNEDFPATGWRLYYE